MQSNHNLNMFSSTELRTEETSKKPTGMTD